MRTQTLNNQTVFNKTSVSTTLSVSLVHVTPEVATNYLRFNNKNRKPSDRNVKFLASQMSQNLFIQNGESIVFDRNNELKDGQHRLLAIIKSGKSYFIPVVRGVKPSSMATYDTGKNRSASDVLSISGYKYSGGISGLIKSIHKFKFNKSKHSRLGAINRYEALTNQQVLDYCEFNYDWLKGIVQKCVSINGKAVMSVISPSSTHLIAYLLGGEKPSIHVYEFIKHLTGVLRTEDTATSYLYTKLYNSKVNKEPLNFYWVLGMTIKAWNFYCEGNPSVRYFKFSTEQELPKINKYNQ
ncbi:MAG: hypothetical protein ABF246_11555 [Winogradskyella sp.]|jgi:hypothetical protein